MIQCHGIVKINQLNTWAYLLTRNHDENLHEQKLSENTLHLMKYRSTLHVLY